MKYESVRSSTKRALKVSLIESFSRALQITFKSFKGWELSIKKSSLIKHKSFEGETWNVI